MKMPRTINVLHIIHDLHLRSGGTSRAVVEMTNGLSHYTRDIHASILTQQRISEASLSPDKKYVSVITAKSSKPLSLRFGLPLRTALRQITDEKLPFIVHTHGIWLPSYHFAIQFAIKHGIPYIVQPHGMLSDWAMEHHGIKKRLFMSLYQRENLRKAALIQATSIAEFKAIRQLGFTQPIALIPNGIVLPEARIINATSASKEKKTALFLSRIHPSKGVIHLLQAWAALLPSGWVLKVAGPDEDGYLAEVLAQARKLGISHCVEFTGPLYDEDKINAYKTSDLFILPTYSENFGLVVAEALSYGLPVITTKGAPWVDLETYNCGWWVETGTEPLIHALNTATTIPDELLANMSKNAIEYVQRYHWEEISNMIANVYRWMLKSGEKPDYIYTD